MVRLPRSEAQSALSDEDAQEQTDGAARLNTRAPSQPSKARKTDAEPAELDDGDNLDSSPAPQPSPQVPVMTGTHFHSLDEKGRIIVPAKLRPALPGGFWMMIDEKDNIGIYPYQTGMDILAYLERMFAEHSDDEEIAMAVERTTEAMEFVEVEGGWRVPIPEFLRFRATLEKDVVTVGVLNHAVLWDRTKWEDAQAAKLESPEVRRTQARLLRAAASGVGLKRAAQTERKEDDDVARGTAGDAGTDSGTASASSRDGGRSPRVLTLSQLGKGR